MKKLIAIILGFALALTLVACTNDNGKVKVEITLDATEVTLTVGDEYTINPKLKGEATLEYSSSDASVLSLEGNKVKALKAGEATVTVKAGDATATLKVKVEAAKEELDLKVVFLELEVGATYDLELTQEVTITSNNEAVVKVEGKKLTALAEGSAKITVALKSDSSVKKDIDVTVVKAQASLVINEKPTDMFVGDEAEVTYELLNSTNTVSVVSLDSSLLKFENGKLVALAAGIVEVEVRVEGESELTQKFIVVITERPAIAITGQLEVVIGSNAQLNATLTNLTGTVTWASSDATIASIDANGLVSGLKEGTVEFTATCGEVTSEPVSFTVKPVPLTIVGPTKVYVGERIELTVKLGDTELTDVEWETSDAMYATVADGVVTGVQIGTVTIQATYQNNSGMVDIEVCEKPTITIKGREVVYLGKTTQLQAIVTGTDEAVVWSSGNDKVMTVVDGLVTGLQTGVTYITATVGDISFKVKFTCMEEPDQVALEFDGGVSEELYRLSATPKTQIKVDNFMYNGGAFWANENYRTYVFMGTKNQDPGATFSDRIYIGKDADLGCYKIVGMILNGGSSWQDGAEYVITISSSYKDYRKVDAEVQKLSVGDIVIGDIPFTKDITLSNPCTLSFYTPKTDAREAFISKNDFTTLPNPFRLGYEFLGWYDNNDTKVTTVDTNSLSGTLELTAKWNQLNPVTNIIVTGLKKELTKGERVELLIMLVPEDAYFKTVYFSSSDTDILTVNENGVVFAKNAGTATITVTDYVGNVSVTKTVTIYPKPSINVKFDAEFDGNLMVDGTTKATASYSGKGSEDATFTYESSDNNVFTVDAEGNILATGAGDATLTCKTSAGEYTISYPIHVGGYDNESRIDELLNILADGNYATAQYGNVCKYDDGKHKYYEATYGSLNKFLFDEYTINTSYAETAANNPSGHKDRTAWHGGVEFVTVHDTATLTGTVVNIASYMATGEVSIHYTTGNGSIYQVVPEKYIAYHAGDGTGTQFQWYASGVKLDHDVDPFDYDSYPKITIDGSGNTYYFYIDGQKTKIQAPISNGSRTISNPSNINLSDLGPVWKIVNGEVYIGTTWVDFSQFAAGTIGSHGGNNNSIGIEMCVNYTTNQWDTYMRTSQLVADILLRYDLDLTRVKMHNTWTGKNCPQCLRAGGNWWDFMDMVATEYKVMKDYKDLTITFSCDSDIVDETGLIVNAPEFTTVVNYTVTVSDGKTSKSINLSSVVTGTTAWEQWKGDYPSKLLWQGGKFYL